MGYVTPIQRARKCSPGLMNLEIEYVSVPFLQDEVSHVHWID